MLCIYIDTIISCLPNFYNVIKHLLRNFNLFIFKKKRGNYRTLVKAVECISLYKTILALRIL